MRTWTRNFTIRDRRFQFVRSVRSVRSVRIDEFSLSHKLPLSPIGNYIYDPQIFFTNGTVRTIREAIFSSYGPYDSYGSTNFSKFHLVTSCLFHLLETIFTIRKSFSRTVRFVRSVKLFSVRTVRTIRTDRRIFPSFT